MSEYGYSEESGFSLKSGFGCKTIWVIESLRPGDYRTGKELFDDVLYYKHVQDSGLLVEFREVEGRDGLFSVLDEINIDLRTAGNIPLIHFDTHGNQNGFELRSGEFIPFEELLPSFRQINEFAQNNLFVVAAACHGEHLAYILHDSLLLPCPFWGVCGPSVEIRAGDLLKGLKAFYEALISTASINTAVESFRAAAPPGTESFRAWNSEFLFLIAFRFYMENARNPYQVDERITRMIEQHRRGALHKLNDDAFREYLRQELGTMEGQSRGFSEMKHRFFMHDKFPENQSKFNPSFEDMLRIRTF